MLRGKLAFSTSISMDCVIYAGCQVGNGVVKLSVRTYRIRAQKSIFAQGEFEGSFLLYVRKSLVNSKTEISKNV